MWKEGIRMQGPAVTSGKPGGNDAEDRAAALARVWRTTNSDNWRGWRSSWGEWLSLGVFYGTHGYDLLSVRARQICAAALAAR